MPTKVERSCSSMNAPHHHDHATRNNAATAHHKEALRLALGSILAPKRSHTPMSRSSSGSATPAVHHDSSHTASLGWPQLAVSESAHAHICMRPGCSSLPHTHSHSPSAHSTHANPQTTPPPGAHPPQTTHPHHRHPLSTHPSHPSTFARPDLSPSTSSLSSPQISQSQASSTHPYSHPPSLPHSHPHSPPFTPSHGHPTTPPHVLGHSTSPGHSGIPSGAVTPAGMTEGSPSTVHSPAFGPSSVPEEEPLQMLPPLVAAGSTSANGEVHDLAPPPAQAVHPRPRPRSHPLQTTAPALEASFPSAMGSVHPDGRSRSEGTQAQRAGFIQTLQSKNSAWDALIHGSFS